MKLRLTCIAASLVVLVGNASATPVCKVKKVGEQWTLDSFTPHPWAGAMTYSSSDNSVAIVDAKGAISAFKKGTSTITAMQAATKKATADTKACSLTVLANASTMLWEKVREVTYTDQKIELPLASSDNRPIVYISSDIRVADHPIVENGKLWVTLKNGGEVTFTATQAANDQYLQSAEKLLLKINPARVEIGVVAAGPKDAVTLSK